MKKAQKFKHFLTDSFGTPAAFKKGDPHPDHPEWVYDCPIKDKRRGKNYLRFTTPQVLEHRRRENLARLLSLPKDVIRERSRKQREANPARHQEAVRKSYRKHKEKRLQYTAQYKEKNYYKIRALVSGNRVSKDKRTYGEDVGLIASLYEMRDRLTACLQTPFEVDHIIPVAAGGSHTPTNLQVITRRQNSRKRCRICLISPPEQTNNTTNQQHYYH
jgi:hypothetical protein